MSGTAGHLAQIRLDSPPLKEGTPGSNTGGAQVNTSLALVMEYTTNAEHCDKKVEATLSDGRDIRGGGHAAAQATTLPSNTR